DVRALFVATDVLPNGVQQVSLAEADTSIKEERVVRFAGRLGDSERGGVCEIIVVLNDESVEGIFRIEAGLVVCGVVAVLTSGFGDRFGFMRRGDERSSGRRMGSGGDFEFDLKLAT